MRIVRHMKYRSKFDAPRILFRRTFFNKNRNSCVDILCDVKITLRSEDRAGTSIRVDQSQVTSREYNTALIFLQVPDAMEKEYKFSTFLRRVSITSEREQTKLVTTVDTQENS